MKPSEISVAVEGILDANLVPLLLSSPGIGKTSLAEQIAKKRGMKFDAVLLSQLDSVDLRGVPSIVDGRTTWHVPEFFPKDGKHLILLDEFTACRPDVEVAAYQLVLERKVGNYHAPPGVQFILAGNRVKDRAQARNLGTAIKNRVITLEMESNVDDWCLWALTSDIHDSVLSFIRFRPNYLNELEPQSKSKEAVENAKKAADRNSFCTPRSLKFLSDLVKANIDKGVEYNCYAGAVGEAAATEFMHFLKVCRDLPDLDLVLAKPDKKYWPTNNPAAKYAIATGLASRVTNNNLPQALAFVEHMEPEFKVLTVKDISTRNPAVGREKSMVEFLIKNAKILR